MAAMPWPAARARRRSGRAVVRDQVMNKVLFTGVTFYARLLAEVPKMQAHHVCSAHTTEDQRRACAGSDHELQEKA